eukprot:tig00000178_g12783.t1
MEDTVRPSRPKSREWISDADVDRILGLQENFSRQRLRLETPGIGTKRIDLRLPKLPLGSSVSPFSNIANANFERALDAIEKGPERSKLPSSLLPSLPKAMPGQGLSSLPHGVAADFQHNLDEVLAIFEEVRRVREGRAGPRGALQPSGSQQSPPRTLQRDGPGTMSAPALHGRGSPMPRSLTRAAKPRSASPDLPGGAASPIPFATRRSSDGEFDGSFRYGGNVTKALERKLAELRANADERIALEERVGANEAARAGRGGRTPFRVEEYRRQRERELNFNPATGRESPNFLKQARPIFYPPPSPLALFPPLFPRLGFLEPRRRARPGRCGGLPPPSLPPCPPPFPFPSDVGSQARQTASFLPEIRQRKHEQLSAAEAEKMARAREARAERQAEELRRKAQIVARWEEREDRLRRAEEIAAERAHLEQRQKRWAIVLAQEALGHSLNLEQVSRVVCLGATLDAERRRREAFAAYMRAIIRLQRWWKPKIARLRMARSRGSCPAPPPLPPPFSPLSGWHGAGAEPGARPCRAGPPESLLAPARPAPALASPSPSAAQHKRARALVSISHYFVPFLRRWRERRRKWASERLIKLIRWGAEKNTMLVLMKQFKARLARCVMIMWRHNLMIEAQTYGLARYWDRLEGFGGGGGGDGPATARGKKKKKGGLKKCAFSLRRLRSLVRNL